MFWFVFLITPTLLVLTPSFLSRYPRFDVLHDYGLIEAAVSLLAGSSVAAFLLALLREKTHWQLVTHTVAFSLLFAIVLGLISFGGCMLASNI